MYNKRYAQCVIIIARINIFLKMYVPYLRTCKKYMFNNRRIVFF